MNTPPPLPPPLPPHGHDAVPPILPVAAEPLARTSRLTKIVLWSVGGFLALVVGFFGFRAYQFAQWMKHREPQAMDFFGEASRNIGPGRPGASGNSERAREMAAEMSKVMLAIRTMGFEQADKKSLLDSDDQFRTYCDLRTNQCVFLIHIPELRRFTEEAKDTLGSFAWKSGQAVLNRKDAGREGMKLAIGIMGLVSYERVMFGQYSSKPTVSVPGPEAVERGFGCEKTLYDWFAPASTNSQPGRR